MTSSRPEGCIMWPTTSVILKHGMMDCNEYEFTCPKCGNKSIVKSNQPAGGEEPFICSCYRCTILRLPDDVEGRYLYQVRPDTLELQTDIVRTIADIGTAMTVRQIFYRLVAAGHPKQETFYNKVQRTLLDMRERGTLPYGLIADNTRSYYTPDTHSNLHRMLEDQQKLYRRDFWQDQPIHLELWLEKEALRNVFWDITDYYQVPLYVSKGLSSVSFVFGAAEEIKRIGKPTVIYLFSDYDPSGLVVTKSIERRMREFDVHADFIRGGLTPEQIAEYNVATRKTKKSTHSKGFVGKSAELDALHPRILKSLVRRCIEQHMDMDAFHRLTGIEEAEKQTLATIANNLRHAS